MWKGDAAACVGHLGKSNTGTLGDPKISETGRQFLADLLIQLTDRSCMISSTWRASIVAAAGRTAMNCRPASTNGSRPSNTRETRSSPITVGRNASFPPDIFAGQSSERRPAWDGWRTHSLETVFQLAVVRLARLPAVDAHDDLSRGSAETSADRGVLTPEPRAPRRGIAAPCRMPCRRASNPAART
jgi:hypothetical protein